MSKGRRGMALVLLLSLAVASAVAQTSKGRFTSLTVGTTTLSAGDALVVNGDIRSTKVDATVGDISIAATLARTGGSNATATERGVAIQFVDGDNPTLTAGISAYRETPNITYNGGLKFWVSNMGGGTPANGFTQLTERMRITPAGQVLVANGTLSAPGLSFLGDSSMGLEYAPGSGINLNVSGVRSAQVTSDRLTVLDRANGTGVRGPFLLVGRNTSGTGAAGAVVLADKSAAQWTLWMDTTGVLRVNSTAPVEAGSDTIGTVVGTQTSSRASKNVLGQVNDYAPAAMDLIRHTPIWAFTYRNGAYGGQTFYGITTDDSPLFGMDGGKSFNPVTAFGATVLSLQDLDRRVQDLEAKLAAALATIETLTQKR